MKIEATCVDGMHNGARTKTHSNGTQEVEHLKIFLNTFNCITQTTSAFLSNESSFQSVTYLSGISSSVVGPAF